MILVRETEAMLGNASPRKPERADALEIVDARDLAGRMARQRERQFVALDAAAIVADTAQLRAAILDLDLDALGAGVEAVLDQLLEHRGGPFDDLAGGDLVNELLGKNADRHQEVGGS